MRKFLRYMIAGSPEASRQWRQHGRNWAVLGELERSEWCHALADYWILPGWRTLFVDRTYLRKPPPIKGLR